MPHHEDHRLHRYTRVLARGEPDSGGECVRRQLANRPRALAMVTDLFSLPQRHDPLVTTDTEYWEMRANRVSDVGRR